MILNARVGAADQEDRAAGKQEQQEQRPGAFDEATQVVPEVGNCQSAAEGKVDPDLHGKLEDRVHALIVASIQEIADVDQLNAYTERQADQEKQIGIAGASIPNLPVSRMRRAHTVQKKKHQTESEQQAK